MVDIIIDLICGFFLFSISLICGLAFVEAICQEFVENKKAYYVFFVWGIGTIIVLSLLYFSLNRFGMA
jgi:hypothetical protein